jgi:hypothetical protein
LQVSRRNLAFLHGIEILEELVEVEGDVVGLLLLIGFLLRWWGWRLWRWGWQRRRRLSTGLAAMP